MKYSLVLAVGLLAAGSVLADTNNAASVSNAVAKLAAAPNYSWTVTLQLPNAPFTPSPVNGSTEKGGYSIVSQEFNGDTMQAVFKGNKIAVKGEDDWQSISDADDQTAMMAGWLVNAGTPAAEATRLLKDAADLTNGDNGTIGGNLTPAGATEMLTPPARGGNTPPPPKNAKGSVRFWLNPDGTLAKFESHLGGQMSFGPDQQEQDFEVIRTVAVRDVGTTKVAIPDGAMKALGSKTDPAS
ncbi:MAG TPA: hypothetical protein VMH30_11250 [Verrucomicrobiae bacterium]|nr:hypothetical protein [Verrucomicrobiae bacterium]